MKKNNELKKNHASHAERYTPRDLSPLETLSTLAARRALKTVYNKTADPTIRDLLNALTADTENRADADSALSDAQSLVQTAAAAIVEYCQFDGVCGQVAAQGLAAATLEKLTSRCGFWKTDKYKSLYCRVWYAALKAVRREITTNRATHGRKAITATRTEKESPCMIIDADGNERAYISGKDVMLDSSIAYPIEFVSIHAAAPNAPDAFIPDVLTLESADALEESFAGVALMQAARAELKPEQFSIFRMLLCGWTVRDIAAATKKSASTTQGKIETIRRRLARSDFFSDNAALEPWRK